MQLWNRSSQHHIPCRNQFSCVQRTMMGTGNWSGGGQNQPKLRTKLLIGGHHHVRQGANVPPNKGTNPITILSFPYKSRFLTCLFPSGFPIKILQARLLLLDLTIRTERHETLHCVISIKVPLTTLGLMSSSTPYSPAVYVYDPPSMWEIPHPHKKTQNYKSVNF